MISVWAPDGVADVHPGDDLAALLLSLVELADGDVVCVTSKVVSKSEGNVLVADRADAVRRETRRLVAQRGPLQIVVNRLGLTMAAAGVDASNVRPGSVVLLPADPDASARGLRTALTERAGVNVAVVVTDTAGRAWREGQTDIAIGAAGLVVLDDHAGRVDPYGNQLTVTAPAVADELAGAAELAAGKLSGRPFVVVRGRGDLVLPPGEDGPGAGALVRAPETDLFGLGSRDAVVAALAGDPSQRSAFGAPAAAEELTTALTGLLGRGVSVTDDLVTVLSADVTARWVAVVAAYAHGWEVSREDPSHVRLRPVAH